MKKLRKIIGSVTAAVAMVSLLFNFTACNTGSSLSSTDESQFAQDNVQLIDLGDAFASLNKGNLEVSTMVTQSDGGELILEYNGIENNNGDVYCKIILKSSLISFAKKSSSFLLLFWSLIIINADIPIAITMLTMPKYGFRKSRTIISFHHYSHIWMCQLCRRNYWYDQIKLYFNAE